MKGSNDAQKSNDIHNIDMGHVFLYKTCLSSFLACCLCVHYSLTYSSLIAAHMFLSHELEVDSIKNFEAGWTGSFFFIFLAACDFASDFSQAWQHFE